jgi:hypothetical protein
MNKKRLKVLSIQAICVSLFYAKQTGNLFKRTQKTG